MEKLIFILIVLTVVLKSFATIDEEELSDLMKSLNYRNNNVFAFFDV